MTNELGQVRGAANVAIYNCANVFFHKVTNITLPELEVKSIVTPHIITNFISSASLFIKKY